MPVGIDYTLLAIAHPVTDKELTQYKNDTSLWGIKAPDSLPATIDFTTFTRSFNDTPTKKSKITSVVFGFFFITPEPMEYFQINNVFLNVK